MKLVYALESVDTCDNRYGFDLEWFPPGAVASLIDLDCAIAVVSEGKLMINVDSGAWYRYKGELIGATDAAVNAILAEIPFNPDELEEDDEDDLDYIDRAFVNMGKWEVVD